MASTLQIQPVSGWPTKLMNQVRNKAIYISYKYKIQIEPIQFQLDKFLPSLEIDF